MAKRDIKAKRWLKRRFRREHGEWGNQMFTIFKAAKGMRTPANTRVFVCGRQVGMDAMRATRDIWCW